MHHVTRKNMPFSEIERHKLSGYLTGGPYGPQKILHAQLIKPDGRFDQDAANLPTGPSKAEVVEEFNAPAPPVSVN